ncbi:DUF2169 domain-containing protein [Paracoccus sp. Z118]|uniref:DUF2169 family type VI secretion system accessory protein n=1 Tax=Paracoccus sp. Z118 TaxID=2851017 RepID=UPI001C2B9E28|nr:DUF2169 domain-containing protein [Paracoccus sp. Z118]MBV0890913.1 DUF2169 domain-containing protein [Paracoccus sp. Z118]
MGIDTHIENRTPFDLKLHVQMDADGQEVTVLMLSASFTADPSGRLSVAEAQLPVTYADIPRGDPARSSLCHDADIAPRKPVPEVILNASAYAPQGRPAGRVDVGLQLGGVRKMLAVTGDRLRAAGGLSDPQPFVTMPLIWERAFGGTAGQGAVVEQRNPVGVGLAGSRSADAAVLTEVPNITRPAEIATRPDQRPEPVGFGVVARGWRPRLDFAGTHDDGWLANQWPLPPRDLDPRHHQAAPADQQSPSIRPGAVAVLVNMTPEGRWEFRLPRLTAPLRLLHDDRAEEAGFAPDTVVIEPDLRRITLKARMAFVTDLRAPRLREILYGHVSPVLLSARLKRKGYLDPLGGDGTRRLQPVWEEA